MHRIGLTFALCFLLPSAALAQEPARVARVGYLSVALGANPERLESFRQGLRDLGYVENRNVVIESRSADRHLERLDDLAAELVRLKVDVLVTDSTPPTLAAKKATPTIPIVFAATADAVGSGIVTTLARPGGNLTGLSFLAPELVGKCLEQLKEAVPRITRVAVLWEPGGLGESTQRDMLQQAEVAARALRLQLQRVEARAPGDFDKAFAQMIAGPAGAMTVLKSVMLFVEHKRLVDLAARNRLPAVYPWREPVDAGGFLSYGPNLNDLYRRAAYFVDKILKGARPGDLPVEQPTKFELVINLRTAKTLGLDIPRSIRLRADQVIQ